MDYYTKEGLKLFSKGVGIATAGATSQALTVIGASVFWQVPVATGMVYLAYSSVKQSFKILQKERKLYKESKNNKK